MEVHLPKPIHGWRQFFGGVGIIVLGVLIALGGEQAVEEVHHRTQLHEVTNRLRAEGIGNRRVLPLDSSVLRKSVAQIVTDMVALNM